jgi:NAD(P)H-flavin reductase
MSCWFYKTSNIILLAWFQIRTSSLPVLILIGGSFILPIVRLKKKLMESRKNITKVVYKHTTSTKITKNIFKSKKREKKITIKNILTEDNLKKKGWQGEENCVFCNELETVDHLFINCSVSQQL